MRVALVLVAILGCKKSEPTPPPPAPGSAAVQVALPIDAAVDATAPDAPPAPTGLVITKDGLSVMRKYNRNGKSDEETVADIQTKLPTLKVGFDVMEYADEHEEGYYSAKQGEEEVAQFWRTEKDGVETRVTGPMFVTEEGIHPGDKLSAVIAKHPDVTCEGEEASEIGLLQCTTSGLLYVLNAEGYKGKRAGKLAAGKLAERPIFMIATIPPGP